MTVLAVTDLHLTDNAGDEYRHEFMEKHLMKIVQEEKPKALVILGDLTEEKDRHRSKLVNRIARQLDDLAYECPVLCVMGNHDYANEGFPFFEFVRRFRDIEFISQPTRGRDLREPWRYTFQDDLFLPHTRNYAEDWDGFNPRNYANIWCHNTFEQAQSEHGSRLKGIPLDYLAGGRVWCGDVHTPQATPPVTYIGAPYTVDFGDDYQPRMLKLKGEAFDWIMLHKLPQKVLVRVEEGKDLEDYRKDFAEGDLLKVRVVVDTAQGFHATADIVRRQAQKFGATAVKVEPVVLNKSRRREVKVDGQMQTDPELVRSFADRHKLDDATLKVGLDLLNE